MLLQRVEYAAYRAVAALVRRTSEDRLARWGSRLGRLIGRVIASRSRLALRNLRAAFPQKSERECREILDRCWRHFGWEALLYLHMQNMSLAEIAERCPPVNVHILDEAIAEGRGTILISAHFGGWEVGGLAIMGMAANVRTVARPLDNEYLERDLQRIRERTGAQMIDRNRAARPLLEALHENATVVMLPDQRVLPREGILVPFLGRDAWTTPGPAKMALRLGARIIFAFCMPEGTRHQLEFEEPIRIDDLRDEEKTPEALTRRINDVISRRIAANPELWLWMHDRWKGNRTADGETADAK